MEILLIGVGSVAAMVAIIFFAAKASNKQARERCQAMTALGQSLGLRLLDPIPEDSMRRPPHGVDLKAAYPECPLLQIRNAQTYNVIEGDHKGRQTRLFELSYVVSTGKSSHTVVFGLVGVGVGKRVPWIDVRYEGLWQKVKELFGHSDLKLDNPEFDKRYLVTSSNEGFARSVLDYGVQEEMLQAPFDGHVLTNESVLVYKHGVCAEEQFRHMLDRAHRLADQATVALP